MVLLPPLRPLFTADDDAFFALLEGTADDGYPMLSHHVTDAGNPFVLLSYLTGVDGMTLWTQGGVALPSRDDVPQPAGKEVLAGMSPVARTQALLFANEMVYVN